MVQAVEAVVRDERIVVGRLVKQVGVKE